MGFPALNPKKCSYLTDGNDENKKGKGMKKCVIKRKFKVEDCKKFLKTTQLENKINQHEKKTKKLDDSLRKNHKQFIKIIHQY